MDYDNYCVGLRLMPGTNQYQRQSMIKFFVVMIMCLMNVVPAHAWQPQRPIQIIVPYPPGGAADKLGRAINQMFLDHGWQSVIVNRPGADTVIGANSVAIAPQDGHTLYLGGNGFLDANLVYQAPGIQYTKQSFTPIVPLGLGSLLLLVPDSSPVRTYDEFIKYVRNHPAAFNLGFWNSYTAKIFLRWARLEQLPQPNIVNYKGSAPQIMDLLGGHLPFAFDTITAAKDHIVNGKIRVIAVLDNEGVKIMNSIQHNVHLVAIEQYQPSVALNIFYGLYGPAGIDQKIVEEINSVVNKGLKQQKYQTIWRDLHTVSPGGTASELAERQTKFYNMFKMSIK